MTSCRVSGLSLTLLVNHNHNHNHTQKSCALAPRRSHLDTTFPHPHPHTQNSPPTKTHVELVDTVGSDLVRVEDAEVTAAAANTLLSGGLQATLVLEVVDTLADGLAVGGTLGGGLFAVTATDTDTVDDVALLGLVPEAASLVGARGAGGTVDDRELAELPAAHACDELENVRLLLGVELRKVPAVSVLRSPHAHRQSRPRDRRPPACARYPLVGAHLDGLAG